MAEDTTGPTTKRRFAVVRGAESFTGKKVLTNYAETLMHLVKGYVGTGIFALGQAFMHSGMIVGPILLTAIALLNLHCQHMLIAAAVKVAKTEEPTVVLPTYAETVQYTFADSHFKLLNRISKNCGIATDVILVVAEYGFCICYYIFVVTHILQIVEQGHWCPGYRIMLLIFLVPMLVTSQLGNLKFIFPLSVIANLLCWAGVCIVFYYTLHEPPLRTLEAKDYADWKDLPLFLGTILFSFEGITFIIQLRAEMRNPESFTKKAGVLNVGIGIVVSLYICIGVLAFWKYGEESKGSVFLNMPKEQVLAQVTKGLMAVAVMVSYILHMYIPVEIAYPAFYRRFGPFKHPFLIISLYRVIAVLITYALSNISDNLGKFISLVGASTGGLLAMIIPGMLHLAMYENLKVLAIIKDIFLIVLGIAAGIGGTIQSAYEIVDDLRHGPPNITSPCG